MVLPPKATEAAGKDFASHPVCSGPFKFVERVPQDHVTLERFADYWDAKNIHFDKVVYQVFVDSSVRLANLKAGTIDLTEYIAPTDAAAVKPDPKLRLSCRTRSAISASATTSTTGRGRTTPYGKNALVRQAFDAAIDRAALVNVVFNGMYAPTVQAVPPSSPFYDEALKAPTRDVAKAKALLKQAGVTLPVQARSAGDRTSRTNMQAAEVVQSMAAEAGFDVHIQAMEFASSLQARSSRRLSGLHDRLVRPCRYRRQYLPVPAHRSGQQQRAATASTTVDKLLEQARGMTDLAKRRDLYAQIWPDLREDLPFTYLCNPRNIVAMTAKLNGFRAVPDGMIRIQGLEMAK